MISRKPASWKSGTFMDSKFFRSVLEFTGIISLPAAILGILGAFLGWRVSSAYFLTFGIGLGWMKSDFLGLIVTAWVEISLFIFLSALLFITRSITIRIMEYLNPQFKMGLFLALIILLFGLLGFMVIRYLVMHLGFGFLGAILVEGSGLLLWWIFTVVTDQIIRIPLTSLNSWLRKVHSIATIIFSVRPVIHLITAALLVYFLLDFAVIRGTYFATRDMTSESHLPITNITSNSSLGISSEIKIANKNEDLYKYEDLRLITKTDDYVFVFRVNEVDPQSSTVQVHAIPLRNIEYLSISQWGWEPPNPTPPPSVTSSDTQSPSSTANP